MILRRKKRTAKEQNYLMAASKRAVLKEESRKQKERDELIRDIFEQACEFMKNENYFFLSDEELGDAEMRKILDNLEIRKKEIRENNNAYIKPDKALDAIMCDPRIRASER